jgi:hypothetical protein
MTEPVALEQLASSARDALARNDVKAAERADAALAALPYLPAGLSVLRVDVARLRRSREAVRDLTHHALMQWFDGGPRPHPPPRAICGGRLRSTVLPKGRIWFTTSPVRF